MPTRSSPEELELKARFRLEQAELRRRDAEKSLAEHRAKSNAVAAKTVRLRAVRLAKEAQDAAEALAAMELKAREALVREALVKASPGARAKKKIKAIARDDKAPELGDS